jgi:glycosyltransferase involved in cell wall biosynthesis
VIYDVRVEKIVRSLSRRYSISVLGWNRDGFKKDLTDNFIVPLKLFNLKAPYGKGVLVAFFPLFWTWVFINLLLYKPRVVHACDLDCFFPCYIYKVIFNKKIIFDVFDRYAMAYISPKIPVLYSVVNFIEESCSKRADVLVTVTKQALETFRKRPKHCEVIRNCPERHTMNRIKSEDDNMLRLLYTGNVHKARGLTQITSAIKDLNNVELTIIGKVIHQDVLDEILKKPNVKYMGFVERSDYWNLMGRSDAIIILYDLRLPNNIVTSPNKTFEAMSFGLPIITNMEQELVRQVNCGIVVEDYDNINEIKSAVILLRDRTELRMLLGNNGYKAFTEKYNWNIMESILYGIYDDLLAN